MSLALIPRIPLSLSYFCAMRLLAIISAMLLSPMVHGQTDTLFMLNGDVINGEFKEMVNNVITFKAPYTKVDASYKWSGVARMKSGNFFLIHLADGRKYTGSIASINNQEIAIFISPQVKLVVPKSGIVGINQLKRGQLGKLRASFELGYSFTKANSLQQITTRSFISYTTSNWKVDGSLDLLISTQNNVDPTQRLDVSMGYSYFLQDDWFLPVQLKFLSNTEQLLQLRSTALAGIGRYVLHSNRVYLTFSTGLVYSNERFLSEEPNRRSAEAFLATEVNLFNIGDLNLLSSLYAYPSITDDKRFRLDYKFDAKYDLPLDFYLKAGVTFNYDNQPTAGAAQLDYVLQTTLGWKI